MKICAVVFDMDGVIADTEPLQKEIGGRMRDELGIPQPAQQGPMRVGGSSLDIWNARVKEYGLSATGEALKNQQFRRVLELAAQRGLPPSDGLVELLRLLRQRGIPTAIASSSDHFYVRGMVEYLGIAEYFDAIVGGDEVPARKPAPDLYQKAMELIGAKPQTSLAIEDSPMGIQAALAAGMACCGYQNPTSGQQDLSAASFRVKSLREVAGLLEEGQNRAGSQG